ncbi:fungal cellulose binding domain-containing protein [Colletotrichum scovillei]|uniref:Fungal cellulose binding domain-containing protein n=1 Tax=Colletotrichum scovillei TaxID=1209932 RepID=A0A9P7QY40_9PEZI|nr:fungal cellulose binding domain-containing protein [Colletotrichum scovillei]KAG7045832.1 fungal cellulose binding domain-containing protein [Colletotrichum scovillei]KAG7063176.1 fungal cellulose binding domain-containing protein [Colletotrichum scovillei]
MHLELPTLSHVTVGEVVNLLSQVRFSWIESWTLLCCRIFRQTLEPFQTLYGVSSGKAPSNRGGFDTRGFSSKGALAERKNPAFLEISALWWDYWYIRKRELRERPQMRRLRSETEPILVAKRPAKVAARCALR